MYIVGREGGREEGRICVCACCVCVRVRVVCVCVCVCVVCVCVYGGEFACVGDVDPGAAAHAGQRRQRQQHVQPCRAPRAAEP